MTNPPKKKPRDIRDLKARLGRTLTPQTRPEVTPRIGGTPPGASPFAPPGGGMPPGAPAPPQPPPNFGGVPGPTVPGPAATPPTSPFQPPPAPMQQNLSPLAPQPAAHMSARPPAPIDDSPVEAKETGTKKRIPVAMLAVGAVVGILAGYAIANTMADRKLYNRAVRDGKSLDDAVEKSSKTMERAQSLALGVLKAALGQKGQKPTLDVAKIKELRGLEKPFQSQVIIGKQYGAFGPEAVDLLFNYLNGVTRVWDNMATLGKMVGSNARLKALESTVSGAGGATTACVPAASRTGMRCSLVFSTTPDKRAKSVKVRAQASSGRSYEKTLFTGEEDLSKNPSQYAILVDSAASVGVLGSQADNLGDFSRVLRQVVEGIAATRETETRLKKKLEEVAKLDELFAL